MTVIAPKQPRRQITALDLALRLLSESYGKLSEDDLKDFHLLLKELRKTREQASIDEIIEAMKELLDSEPSEVAQLTFADDTTSGQMQRWLSFISKRIRLAREEAKLSQVQLATRTGIHQAHLSRIENGLHSPTHKTLAKIAKAVRKPVDYFQIDPMK